ncbi:MAG: signal peptidase I [Bacillota bacterium]
MTKIRKEILEWVITITAAALIAFLINLFGGLVIVEGQSMNPTLNDKDILIRATYRFSEPQYGDIIAFKTDLPHPWKIYRTLGIKKALVKRVIGLPGDSIRIANGEVFRNNVKLDEPYLKDGITDGEIDTVVAEGCIFVMGDNRLNSNDSRRTTVGFVEMERVIGEVKLRLWPFKDFGKVE